MLYDEFNRVIFAHEWVTASERYVVFNGDGGIFFCVSFCRSFSDVSVEVFRATIYRVHYTTSSYYMTKMFQMRMIQKSQHRLTKRTLMNKTLSRQVTMICHQVWGHLPTKMESSSLKSLIKTTSRRISFITIPFNMSSTYWNGRMGMGWLRQQIFSSTCDWL